MVLGANPPFAIFEGFIKRIWGKLGIDRIAWLNVGFTLVKFRDESTRDLVLEARVLHFDRKPMIVKPWSADLDTLKAVKSIPVWIRFPGLGLQYWVTKCLSAFMSTIGNPILVDKVTKDRSMIFWNLSGFQLNVEVAKCMVILKECVIGSNLRLGGRKAEMEKKRLSKKTATKDLPESQEVSKQQGHLIAATKQVDEPDRNSRERSTLEWTTPKQKQQVYFMESHNILSWNVRGINKREKQKSLSSFCFVNKIGLGALLETKLRGDKIEKMMSSFFIGWSYFSGSASEGRILLNWQQHLVSIEVWKESDQLLHVFVKEVKSNKLFCVTFVYGRNSIEERLPLWVDLTGLCFPATPWLVSGDFYAVFEGTDRVGGRTITALELADAQKWRALGLVDELRSRGSHYTWTNKHANEDKIYSKLDRIFKNEEWLDLFP
ncbi:uncharacterized protein LOC133832386 [Humulus lupulus]|uniref:uncharacterized protein LOC133832386 n=1 Tax=Humulus lupulus TaxID=3486 RepID=UPI002B4146CC|nr:uncharacterized protein LOC133832386 [Humulus lupulus]